MNDRQINTVRQLIGDLAITLVAGGICIYAVKVAVEPKAHQPVPQTDYKRPYTAATQPTNPSRGLDMGMQEKVLNIDINGRGPVDIHATIDYDYMPTGYDTDGPPEVHINGIYGAGDNLMQYMPQETLETLEQDILEHEQDSRTQ